MPRRKFVKFMFIVGTERQRERLIKFLNKHKLVDDTLASIDLTYLPTWKYPERFGKDGELLEVEFRTHTEDVGETMAVIIAYMGRAIKAGFAEIIKQVKPRKH